MIVKILDGRHIVISDQKQLRHIWLQRRLRPQEHPVPDPLGGYAAAPDRQVHIAPVDADIVAGAAQHILLNAAHAHGTQIAAQRHRLCADAVLQLFGYTKILRRQQPHLRPMELIVRRMSSHFNIGYRAGQQVQILRQHRRGESHRQLHTRRLKHIGRGESLHGH